MHANKCFTTEQDKFFLTKFGLHLQISNLTYSFYLLCLSGQGTVLIVNKIRLLPLIQSYKERDKYLGTTLSAEI